MKEQTWRQWVRIVERDPETPSRLRKGCLAPLTGTDARALDAFVACLKLYAYTGERRVIGAASTVLIEMQDSTRWIARELIPFVMNWEDRERLWPLLAPVPLKFVHVEDHG
jgi:hypothetical protein